MGRRRPQDGPRRDIGLALRAHRRARGESQRAYAAGRGIGRETIARAEVDAGSLRLADLLRLLDETGFELVVLPVGLERPEVCWDATDLRATTRSGHRFPAHRAVRPSRSGPAWWVYHELVGRRSDGPPPRWTAEGFIPPPGTRYGRPPRPYAEGEGPRWPY